MSDQADYSIVQTWLSTCEHLHAVTCSPSRTEGLSNICLIDVNTRQLVPYSIETRDYLALSYVWGTAVQHYRGAGVIGTSLGEIAQTIEDAITLTKKIGKSYLWADSICINQQNRNHKLSQIALMSQIYQGAYATIVALSGASSHAGLARVEKSRERFSQMKCTLDGLNLVSIGPSLYSAINMLPWGKRAWTFQEALMSPRCIYFSDFQMYFECNAMQCSESLDESYSWIHRTIRDESLLQAKTHDQRFGEGIFRSPFIKQTLMKDDRLWEYQRLVHQYSDRLLTNQNDIINAFSGVLQVLTSKNEETFFWAHPLAHFDRVLLWESLWQHSGKRRDGFPSWSWTSWVGQIWIWQLTEHQLPLDLKIWRKFDSGVGTILETSNRDNESPDGLINDPLMLNHTVVDTEDCLHTLQLEHPGLTRLICVESFIFTFTPELLTLRSGEGGHRHFKFFDMTIGGIPLKFRITKGSAFVMESTSGRERTYSLGLSARQDTFLLLSRNISTAGWVNHYLIMLHPYGSIYQKGPVVMLSAPQNNLGVLQSLNMKRTRVLIT
ncbi:MAG: hypothetical protein MMC23_005875 [Stictis urceolatum]|nr:hypothetical protein [Stictis urceolata]